MEYWLNEYALTSKSEEKIKLFHWKGRSAEGQTVILNVFKSIVWAENSWLTKLESNYRFVLVFSAQGNIPVHRDIVS